MSRVFLALVLCVAVVVGLGLYLGWFHFGSDNVEGKTHITLTVDKDKFKADENKVLDKVHDVGHSGPAKTPAQTEKSPDEAAPSTPLPQKPE
jgi:hypothetical protein